MVSILAFHAGYQGSSPCIGTFLLLRRMFCCLPFATIPREDGDGDGVVVAVNDVIAALIGCLGSVPTVSQYNRFLLSCGET